MRGTHNRIVETELTAAHTTLLDQPPTGSLELELIRVLVRVLIRVLVRVLRPHRIAQDESRYEIPKLTGRSARIKIQLTSNRFEQNTS